MKKILITGGSGFLGRNLAQTLKSNYKVYIASRNNKNNFYASQITGCESLPLDVSNINSVRDVISSIKPDIIIHAAATKFVDLSEKYPMETIDVNIVGSQNVARVAIECGVEYVIGISTDKAAPPVRNIYGISKATMEKMFCLMNGKTNTKFSCVRYGNVAWSTGSVLPLWKKMWEDTKILKTTGPEMRRFFFTIDEAVNLVVNAIEFKETIAGKILSREMKSAQMEDILKCWVKTFGGSYEKVEGRPGDRLDEYLMGEAELPFCEELLINNIKHFIISPNEKSKNPLKEVLHSGNAIRLTEQEIIKLLNAHSDSI